MSDTIIKYTNPEQPGSFSGLSGFTRNNTNIARKKIKKALLKTQTYSLHKPKRIHYKRCRVIVSGIDDQWQIDLVDVRAIKGSNYGKCFILTCIDVFSKYAWAIPIKDKEAKTCKKALQEIIESSKRKPNYIYLDGGKEFLGEFKKYCQNIKILLFPTKSKLKASVVERFNRTLKEKMWRMFTHHSNLKYKLPKNYTNYLDKLLVSYNNSYHRSIKAKPIQVNSKNEKLINTNLYGEHQDAFITFAFKIGDYVRISEEKSLFAKGYTPNWSKEIYIITNKIPSNPPRYYLKDLENQEYSYKFYSEELQKVLLEEFPYDSFKVLEETKDKVYIEKLNSDKEKNWVDKERFLE